MLFVSGLIEGGDEWRKKKSSQREKWKRLPIGENITLDFTQAENVNIFIVAVEKRLKRELLICKKSVFYFYFVIWR